MVKTVSNETELVSIISNANKNTTKPQLIVLDFYAKWCRPCNIISPYIDDLSVKHPNVVFLKVDIDENEAIAHQYKITAVPTFIFIRGGKMEAIIKSSDKTALTNKLKELDISAESTVDSNAGVLVKGQMDLKSLFLNTECECLNASGTHTLENAFQRDSKYLISDTDEQLLLFFSFGQFVKLHSIRIEAPTDTGPKSLKLFINQTSSPDFESCEHGDAVQEIELKPEDLKQNGIIPLKYVKFQNVNKLTIFVMNNQTDAEHTRIDYIQIFGSPVSTTNMVQFKRPDETKKGSKRTKRKSNKS